MTVPTPEPGFVVALDVRTAGEAVRVGEAVAGGAVGLQVGLGLLHGAGPGVVGVLSRIAPVLVDASLHGIPSSVGVASRRLGEYGARWVTVHAAGGAAMVEAACEGLAEGAGGRRSGVLVVTVLTSLDVPAMVEAGLGQRRGRLVARRARMAAAAGAEGTVSAVRELGVVAEVAPGLLRVAPGIREAGADADDQADPATPGEAARRGADLIVVGRPVVRSSDPAAALEALARMARAEMC